MESERIDEKAASDSELTPEETTPQLTPEEIKEKLTLQGKFLKACSTSGWGLWNSPVIGIASKRKPRRKRYDVLLQTDPILYEEQGVSVPERRSIGVQTIIKHENADPGSLAKFMKRATDLICNELKDKENTIKCKLPARRSSWWLQEANDYRLLKKLEFLGKKGASLEYEFMKPDSWYNFDSRGSCVSWNSKGTEMAVGYSARGGHPGWCRHLSVPVNIWSFQSKFMTKNGSPMHRIPFESCVSLVKFHPVLWNYLAVGLCTGEVALIDLYESDRQPEQLIDISTFLENKNYWRKAGKSGYLNDLNSTNSATRSDYYEFRHNDVFVTIDGGGHNDKLVSMQWVFCTDEQAAFLSQLSQNPSKYFLVTASSDGFIAVWSIERRTGQFNLERRYLILASAIPQEYWAEGTSHYQMQCCQHLQILAFDCVDPSSFICSTVGGYVFTGTLLSNTEISETEFTLPRSNASLILDPFVQIMYHERECASKIVRSPYHADVYAYVTQYGRLVIRNQKNKRDFILELYIEDDVPIRDFEWSKRPMLIAVVVKCSIIFYDFSLHQYKSVISIQRDVPIYGISLNMARSNLLLGVDKMGTACVWKLSAELMEESGSEMVDFLKFSKSMNEMVDDIDDLEYSESQESLQLLDSSEEDDSETASESTDDFKSTYSQFLCTQTRKYDFYVGPEMWKPTAKELWSTSLERHKFVYLSVRDSLISSGQGTEESVKLDLHS